MLALSAAGGCGVCLQVLPYWGNLADRKTLRRLLTPSRLYGRAAPFHVALTSYQIAVADEAVLKKVKWQFMILDEAQVGGGGASPGPALGPHRRCLARLWHTLLLDTHNGQGFSLTRRVRSHQDSGCPMSLSLAPNGRICRCLTSRVRSEVKSGLGGWGF